MQYRILNCIAFSSTYRDLVCCFCSLGRGFAHRVSMFPGIRLSSDSTSRWTPLPSANVSYCQVRSGLSPPSSYPYRVHNEKTPHYCRALKVFEGKISDSGSNRPIGDTVRSGCRSDPDLLFWWKARRIPLYHSSSQAQLFPSARHISPCGHWQFPGTSTYRSDSSSRH